MTSRGVSGATGLSRGGPDREQHGARDGRGARGGRDGRGARGGRGGGNTSNSLQQNQLQLLRRDIEKEADVIRYRERCHRAEAENEELTEKLALERSKYDEEKGKLEEQLKGYEDLNRSLQSELEKVKVHQQMKARGSPGQPPASSHNGDLVREVQRLLAEVKEKEFANTKMSRQVNATAAELKKVTAHSKVQSQKLLAMKTSAQAGNSKESSDVASALRSENADLQRKIERLGIQLTNLEGEKMELANEVVLAKATVDSYADDFKKEREDRAKAVGRIESLERQQSALEEERGKRKATVQQEAKGHRRESKSEQERHDMLSVQKQPKKDASKFQQFLGMAWKRDDVAKAQQKNEMKAAKKERDRKTREEKERRKRKIASMDEKSRLQYLEGEIARLEEENNGLKNHMESSDAACAFLVEKLDHAEVMMSGSYDAHFVQQHSHNEQKVRYVDVQLQQRVDVQSPHDRKGKQKPTHLEQWTPPQQRPDLERKQSVSEPKLGVPAASSGIPPQANTTRHYRNVTPREKPNEATHLSSQQNRSSNTTEKCKIILDTSDPNYTSKSADYVNQSAADTQDRKRPVPPPRSLKPPKAPIAAPRSASMDTGRVCGPTSPSSDDYTSLPENWRTKEEEEGDIAAKIDVEIRYKAAEIAATGMDDRRNTLTQIPFDPFLECIYCNRQFRYGEIQKYRKHVNTCAGTVS